jgi:hypothetical protein
MTIYVSMVFDISRPAWDIIFRNATREGAQKMGKKKRATGVNQGPYRCEG